MKGQGLKMKTVRNINMETLSQKGLLPSNLEKNQVKARPWTEIEQKKLEHGLRTVPKTISKDERWDKIATIVVQEHEKNAFSGSMNW